MAVYRGCRLFMNSFEIADSVTYSPPEISIERAWFKAGGMNAPIPIDRGTKAMTASYKVQGPTAASFLFLGIIPGVTARLTVRRAYRGMGGVDYLEEEIEGFIDTIHADEHGNDNKIDVGHTMTISVNYYKISANGIIPLLEINPILGLRKVCGINVLGIPANFMSLIL
ncbi:phage major tail tube protein [Buttiauxella gaviniae]|uniref:phage major tail tube protein n=1 Tax=Buttiauxella gaviniae TaxID=82990 RepID=UPI0039769C45